MATSSALTHMRIGFEYETLVLYHGVEEKKFLDFLDQFLGKYKCKQANTTSPAKRLPEIQRYLRHHMGYAFNRHALTLNTTTTVENIPNTYYFRAADDYGEEPCNTFGTPANETRKDLDGKLSETTWAVTHDGSVKVLQKKETGKFVRMYENMQSIASPTQHAGLTESKYVVQNVEIVSPVLTLQEVTTVIPRCLDYILPLREKQDGEVKLFYFNNSSTSNHIHFSMPDDVFRVPQNLLKICMAWWYFEPVFMHLVPYWRRNNEYCAIMHSLIDEDKIKKLNGNLTKAKFFCKLPDAFVDSFQKDTAQNATMSDHNNPTKEHTTQNVKNNGNEKEKSKYQAINKIIDMFQGDPKLSSSRYAALNLMNLKKGGHGTVEIRIKHGSNSSEENVAYIQFFAAFLYAAVQNDFVYKTLPDIADVAKYWLVKDTNDVNILGEMYTKLREFITNGLKGEDRTQFKASKLIDMYFKMHLNCATADEYATYTASGGGVKKRGGAKGDQQQYRTVCKRERVYRVFCYGSNGSKQLKERTGAKQLNIVAAYLDNYTRIFAGFSSRWNGGVASVHPHAGSRCYGLVAELTKDQLEILDSYEGGYTRSKRVVVTQHPDGRKERVMVYVYIKDNNVWQSPPSVAYLKSIRRMLNERQSQHKKNIAVRGVVPQAQGREVIRTFGYFQNGRLCDCTAEKGTKQTVTKAIKQPKQQQATKTHKQ